MSAPYSYDDLWDAVLVMNPKQIRSSNHLLSILLPVLLANEMCAEAFDQTRLTDIGRNIARNLLMRAYWDLTKNGYYNLKED